MIDWVVPKIRFSGILGISWKMVFALAYTPFWKLNKYAINLAKKIMITLVQLAFYTHSFKTLAKNLNQMFWIPDPSLNLEALLFPKIDVHVPHLHSVRYPIDNYCILLLWILSLYQTRMLAGVGIDVQRSCGAENRAVIFVGNT